MDTSHRCIALPQTKTVNLVSLLSILKSSDPSLLEGNSWIFDGKFRFLDRQPIPAGQKIAFDTFPRSGNSYLRRFLETITGVSTGSNVPLYVTTMLQMVGMLGEEVVDERAWIVKTHQPLTIPWVSPTYISNKIICCVRNPLDIMPSYLNLHSLGSQSAKMEFEPEIEFPQHWDQYVKIISATHANFFDKLLTDTVVDG